MPRAKENVFGTKLFSQVFLALLAPSAIVTPSNEDSRSRQILREPTLNNKFSARSLRISPLAESRLVTYTFPRLPDHCNRKDVPRAFPRAWHAPCSQSIRSVANMLRAPGLSSCIPPRRNQAFARDKGRLALGQARTQAARQSSHHTQRPVSAYLRRLLRSKFWLSCEQISTGRRKCQQENEIIFRRTASFHWPD